MKTIEIEKDTKIIYTSIPPLAVPAITQNYEKNNPRPEKYTYTTNAAGNVEITFEHDETTVATDEERQKLAEYRNADKAWQTGLTEKLMMLFLLEGIDLQIGKATKKKWDTRLSRYYDLEDLEEDDLHLLYLQTFVFKNQDAIQEAIKEIMNLTGVSEEDVKAAEKLF